ncbi:MAG: hypothetical protein OHK0029_35230 [Armatimonadaceae bacterium]
MDDERSRTTFRITRLVRTASSEIYLIWDGDQRIGQADIHYQNSTVYATLILESDLSLDQEEGLIAQLDDDVVQAYMPSFEREDFLVTVFRGDEISHYTDTSGPPDDLGDMDDLDDED